MSSTSPSAIADVRQHPQPEAPVDDGQHADHAPDQQHRTCHLGQDASQQFGDRRDVAVDPLDELTRRVRAMELVVEVEHMTGDADAQRIGRAPRRDGGAARHEHGHDLADHDDREEEHRETAELSDARAVGRDIDDASHDERTRERERRTATDHEPERDPTADVGAHE